MRGGVRIEPLTDWPERLAAGAEVWLDDSTEPMHIARVESGGRLPVLHLDAVASRQDAEALAGRYLEAPGRDLAPDEYYWDDLIGMRVEEQDGSLVGELVDIFRAGGNEVYRIVGPAGERLVPALRKAVVRVDLDARLMVLAADDAEEVR